MKEWINNDFLPKAIDYRKNNHDNEHFPIELYDYLIEHSFYNYFFEGSQFSKLKRTEFLEILSTIAQIYPILAIYIAIQGVFGVYSLTIYGEDHHLILREAICKGHFRLAVAWNEEISGSNLDRMDSRLSNESESSSQFKLIAKKSKISFLDYSNLIAVFTLFNSDDSTLYPRIAYLEKSNTHMAISNSRIIGGYDGIKLNDLNVMAEDLSLEKILLANTKNFVEVNHLIDLFNWCISAISIGTAKGIISTGLEYFELHRHFGQRLLDSKTITNRVNQSYIAFRESVTLYESVLLNNSEERNEIILVKMSTSHLLKEIVESLSPFVYNTHDDSTFLWLCNDAVVIKSFTGSFTSQTEYITKSFLKNF